MSDVLVAPEMIATAATDVAAVGSTLSAEHTAAAGSTVALIPAAADEVSASIAHLFSRYAQDYQSLAGQAAAFHDRFVQHLNASAGSYAGIEAASAASLQPLSASSRASANAIAALPGLSLNSVNNALGQLAFFAHGVGVLLLDSLLALWRFFAFLIKSGVPFELFGHVLFPGF
jgi:hypothetical protein